MNPEHHALFRQCHICETTMPNRLSHRELLLASAAAGDAISTDSSRMDLP